MSLITIPGATLLHVPAPGVEAIALASGELSLGKLGEGGDLVLSVDHATFPITIQTPIVRSEANLALPSYVFVPSSLRHASTPSSTSPSTLIRGLGKVKIQFSQPTSPGAYEASSALLSKFEEVLKENKVWKEKGWYDDEDEAGRAAPETAGYGTTIADTLTRFASLFRTKLDELTEEHVKTTPARDVGPASESLRSAASTTESFTKQVADVTHVAAEAISTAVHDGAKFVGGVVGETAKDLDKRFNTTTGQGKEQGEVRKQVNETARGVKEMGEATWTEVELAAEGVKDASVTAGSAISANAHKGIEHNFGKETDDVAKVLGQSSANVGSAGLDVTMQAMPRVHAGNAVIGAGKGLAE